MRPPGAAGPIASAPAGWRSACSWPRANESVSSRTARNSDSCFATQPVRTATSPSAWIAPAGGGRRGRTGLVPPVGLPGVARRGGGPARPRRGSPARPEHGHEEAAPPSPAAIEGFLQEVLDYPGNAAAGRARRPGSPGPRALARGPGARLPAALRLQARGRSRPRPRLQLRRDEPVAEHLLSQHRSGAVVRKVLDEGADTGGFLEESLRALWRMFVEGMSSSELEVKALGGMLFGEDRRLLLEEVGLGRERGGASSRCPAWTPGTGRPSANASTTGPSTSRTWGASTRRCWNWNRGSRPSPCAGSGGRSSRS